MHYIMIEEDMDKQRDELLNGVSHLRLTMNGYVEKVTRHFTGVEMWERLKSDAMKGSNGFCMFDKKGGVNAVAMKESIEQPIKDTFIGTSGDPWTSKVGLYAPKFISRVEIDAPLCMMNTILVVQGKVSTDHDAIDDLCVLNMLLTQSFLDVDQVGAWVYDPQ